MRLFLMNQTRVYGHVWGSLCCGGVFVYYRFFQQTSMSDGAKRSAWRCECALYELCFLSGLGTVLSQ